MILTFLLQQGIFEILLFNLLEMKSLNETIVSVTFTFISGFLNYPYFKHSSKKSKKTPNLSLIFFCVFVGFLYGLQKQTSFLLISIIFYIALDGLLTFCDGVLIVYYLNDCIFSFFKAVSMGNYEKTQKFDEICKILVKLNKSVFF